MPGLPLESGRHFGIEDRPDGRRVAILSRESARSFWPGEDPLGKRFKWRNDNSADPWYTVIGLCGDIREDGLHKPPKPYIYMSLAQFPTGGGYYFLKTRGDPYAQMRAVEQAARRVDPKTILYRPRTLDELVRDSTWQLNYSMALLGGLAWLALFLALIGVYGVLSYSVRERTREIGVRMALGADRAEVMKLVLGQVLRLAGLGILIGTLAAAGLTRFLRSLLYGVGPLDLLTFAVIALAMLAVAVAAGCIPAFRATRIEPIKALRYE